MEKSRAIIFDFDGTIADAEAVMLEIYKPLAKEYNWPEKLTQKDYFRLKKGSPREIMRWANVRFWQIPRLVKLAREEYKKHAADIKLFDGMPQLIDDLAKTNDIYILSSNEHDTVESILKNSGFKANVHILHSSPLFGKGKILKKLLKAKKYARQSCWMIGDEIRDVEAGKKAGINTIGVNWGLQSESGIKKASPNHIAKKPSDITKFIYNKMENQ